MNSSANASKHRAFVAKAITLGLLSITPLCLQAQTNSPPNLELAISGQFLNKLTTLPINTTQQVNTSIGGADISTLINASGNALVNPWRTGKSGLGFCLNANTIIHSDIDAQIAGPARVFVRTDAVALTHTSSNKCFFLDDSGLKSYGAATNAATKLTVNNLDVWAGGLFRRLKTRIGYRKAQEELANQIPKNEREISERAVTTINDLLDSKTVGMVQKVTTMWKDWIYKATTGSGLLPHAMKFYSTNQTAYVYVPSNDQPQGLQLNPSGNQAAAIRIRPDYVKDLTKVYMAGLTLSDMEILTALVKAHGEYEIPEDLIGSPDEVVMRFSAEKPVEVTFQDDVISLTFNFDQIEINGKTYKNIFVTVPVTLKADPTNGLTIVIPDALEAKEQASGAIHAELTEYLTARWKLIATSKSFAIEPLRKKMAAWLPVRLATATARDDQLTITAINGEPSEFAAVTAKISKMLNLGAN